jgi:hypothetical protein
MRCRSRGFCSWAGGAPVATGARAAQADEGKNIEPAEKASDKKPDETNGNAKAEE